MNYNALFRESQRQASELIGFVDDYSEADWDGEGALPLSQTAIDRAIEFLALLPADFPTGNAMAGIDGSLGVYWQAQAAELYVDFRNDGRIRYFFSDGKGSKDEKVCSHTIPAAAVVEAVGGALAWIHSAKAKTAPTSQIYINHLSFATMNFSRSGNDYLSSRETSTFPIALSMFAANQTPYLHQRAVA